MMNESQVRSVVARVFTAAGQIMNSSARAELDRAFASSMSMDDLRARRAELDGEIARRAGSSLLVTDNGDAVHDVPPGGFLVVRRYCTDRGRYAWWHAALATAKAHLILLGEEDGRAVSEDGMLCNLTRQGCYDSSAWIETRACMWEQNEIGSWFLRINGLTHGYVCEDADGKCRWTVFGVGREASGTDMSPDAAKRVVEAVDRLYQEES